MKRSTHTIAAGLVGITLLVASCGDDRATGPTVDVTTETPVSGAGLPTNGLPASAHGAEKWVDAAAHLTAFSPSADASERWVDANGEPTAFSPTADASERWVTSPTDGCETRPSPDAIERCLLGG